MWITPAYAQAAPAGGNGMFEILFPLVAIILIFYFLLLRPQQQARKKHQQMVANARRGDTVVTAGGIVGKITKVLEGDEVMVEIAENTAVKVLKSSLSDVRSKTEPANDQ